MATLTYQVTALHRGDNSVFNITPVAVDYTCINQFSSDRLTVTFAASLAVPLGEVTTPTLLYASNTDATNYISILDDTVEIARLTAGMTAMIPLPASVVLKAQADTGNCEMDFAVFGTA